MISVIDNYVLDCDGNCYVIGTRTKNKVKRKDGTIELVDGINDPGYYGTLQNALNAICRRVQMNAIKDTNGDLEALYGAVRSCTERLEAAIKQAFPEVEIHA